MPDPELTEDLTRWPGDRFELLGLSAISAEREARPAYIRLIKRFKPDHHPAHFQRIREAYEFVQRQIEIRGKYSEFFPEGDFDSPRFDDCAEEEVGWRWQAAAHSGGLT